MSGGQRPRTRGGRPFARNPRHRENARAAQFRNHFGNDNARPFIGPPGEPPKMFRLQRIIQFVPQHPADLGAIGIEIESAPQPTHWFGEPAQGAQIPLHMRGNIRVLNFHRHVPTVVQPGSMHLAD
jgi:hypothetical protein